MRWELNGASRNKSWTEADKSQSISVSLPKRAASASQPGIYEGLCVTGACTCPRVKRRIHDVAACCNPQEKAR